MDKVNFALCATEDNAAAIRELNKKLNEKINEILSEKTIFGCELLLGSVKNGYTSFGTVTSNGKTGVIVVFAGSSAVLAFGNKNVGGSISPMLAVLPAGTEELALTTTRQSARALVIGLENKQ